VLFRSVGAAFYPMALFSKDFLANVGLVGHFEHSLGGKTQGDGSIATSDLDTALTAYDIGVRVRLPIADHQLGFTAAYGQQQFQINDAGNDPGVVTGSKLVPDVNYKFIRLGADFTYLLRNYFLTGDLGLRIVNSAGNAPGEIQNDHWFPRSDVGGIDFGLTAGYAVSERFTITAGMDFRNFYYSMNSRLTDFGIENGAASGTRRPVAGGANDMYFAGLVAARYSLK